ncbi:PREDICTED: DNA repair protein RAD51 homolog 2-like [Erythranthe guttata]|uniref:DNA repair protein RAD51 homolog 2-like n=1 Tax=Erythranthe guttata TaxID=4155 RepID=UPI00064D7ADE|nr:PREDICTED: DNA repair protein RAD51 homolog 2-like [Erythranthe guttata]|eukprot:XP_012838187.1 PREDICTED: DNA repair protein RAD51 homolog 2-like [Erythranthe guttata]
MANKLISEMNLPKSIANVFAARNIITAKDALSRSEFELMELLDVGLEEVIVAVAHISEIACPPNQTVTVLWMKFWECDFDSCFSHHIDFAENCSIVVLITFLDCDIRLYSVSLYCQISHFVSQSGYGLLPVSGCA